MIFIFCATVVVALGLRLFRDAASYPTLDVHGRVVAYPGKTVVACPEQGARTAVIFVIGQSNVANHAERLMKTAFGEQVVAFFDGKCTIAQSPLLGGTGVGGESLTPMADNLIRSGRFDRVVLAPVAVGGTEISRWATGELKTVLFAALDDVQRRYKVTHAIWHQGESDGPTPQADYKRDFRTILSGLRAHGMQAPVFVSVATRCTVLNPGWASGNPIAEAQLTMPDPAAGIYPGPDTDALIPASERMDRDCHFLAAGQTHFAEILSRAILAGTAGN